MASRLTGNQFWRLRTKHGKDKIFGDPAVLREEAEAYFDWCDRHPEYRTELVKYKGEYIEAEVPLKCPYSEYDLTRYLKVSPGYFRAAKANLREKIEQKRATAAEIELLETIEDIELTIRGQQIRGAMVGIFNPGLTARINALADNTNVTTNTPVLRVTVEGQDAAQALDELDSLL